MTLRRDRKRRQKRTVATAVGKCMKCGHPGAHYVPPSFGDPGFFACESFCAECSVERSTENQEGGN